MKGLKEGKVFLFKEELQADPTKPKPGFKIGADGLTDITIKYLEKFNSMNCEYVIIYRNVN